VFEGARYSEASIEPKHLPRQDVEGELGAECLIATWKSGVTSLQRQPCPRGLLDLRRLHDGHVCFRDDGRRRFGFLDLGSRRQRELRPARAQELVDCDGNCERASVFGQRRQRKVACDLLARGVIAHVEHDPAGLLHIHAYVGEQRRRHGVGLTYADASTLELNR
jgi:hypothetical protein